MTWVEVVAHSAFKERCVLWDNGQASAEVEKTNGASVKVVDAHVALCRLNDTEQCESQ